MSKQESSTYITLEPGLVTDAEKNADIKKPQFFHVILLNDDFTSMDFVIQLLIKVFGKNYQESYDITMQVHHFERGVAGTYSYEIATEKAQQANNLAAMNEYPLQCTIEQQ